MNVIVDTNIIFSALITRNSNRRKYLFDTKLYLYSPNFLIAEIFKHKERILKTSKLSNEELSELLNKILQRIRFVNEELISIEKFFEAFHLCKNIDEDDTPFVALTLELDGKLWTKDDELKTELRKKGFDNFFEE